MRIGTALGSLAGMGKTPNSRAAKEIGLQGRAFENILGSCKETDTAKGKAVRLYKVLGTDRVRGAKWSVIQASRTYESEVLRGPAIAGIDAASKGQSVENVAGLPGPTSLSSISPTMRDNAYPYTDLRVAAASTSEDSHVDVCQHTYASWHLQRRRRA